MEYKYMSMHPSSHLMAYLRPGLGSEVKTTGEVYEASDGTQVTVAGWPIARQHPKGEKGTVFVTIEDEVGDVQLIIWPKIFAKFKRSLGNAAIQATGKISRWDGTTNVIVSHITAIQVPAEMPKSHDWH